MTLRALTLTVLALAGAWSVAVFVGALAWGTPGAADPAPFGMLFRGVLYPVLVALLLALAIGVVLELGRRRARGAHHRLELIWIAIPAVALLALAAGERELRAAGTAESVGEGPPVAELVAGLGAWTGADLVTVLGEPVRISLRSSDVAHSLTLRGLEVELAAVPGQPITGLLPAAAAGEFELTCSVHGRTVGRLRVTP